MQRGAIFGVVFTGPYILVVITRTYAVEIFLSNQTMEIHYPRAPTTMHSLLCKKHKEHLEMRRKRRKAKAQNPVAHDHPNDSVRSDQSTTNHPPPTLKTS
jgi:hypothetical protein